MGFTVSVPIPELDTEAIFYIPFSMSVRVRELVTCCFRKLSTWHMLLKETLIFTYASSGDFQIFIGYSRGLSTGHDIWKIFNLTYATWEEFQLDICCLRRLSTWHILHQETLNLTSAFGGKSLQGRYIQERSNVYTKLEGVSWGSKWMLDSAGWSQSLITFQAFMSTQNIFF